MFFFLPHLVLLGLALGVWFELLPWWREREVLYAFLITTLALPPWCRWRGRRWSGQRAFLLGPGLAAVGFAVVIVLWWRGASDPWMAFQGAFYVALLLLFLGYSAVVFDEQRG
jgi:hypothetical protein